VRILVFALLLTLLSSCKDDDVFTTGSAELTFTGRIEEVRINIYPETVFTVSELLATQSLTQKTIALNGQILIEDFNPGNYTWYDNRDNIGFFQITAGQQRRFEFSIR
jgi:hypothetical protein